MSIEHSNELSDGSPEPLVATVVGLDSNIHNFAREAANNRLHGKIESGGKLSRIGRRIWYGNVARDFYLERYTRQAREQIVESGNLFSNEASGEGSSDRQMRMAVTQRFTSEYEDDVIREGDHKVELSDDGEQGEFKTVIKSLISRYASGELDDDSFQEEKLRVLHISATEHPGNNYLSSGNLYADNLLEIARHVKARCDHDDGRASVDRLVGTIRITSGEARVGASSEVRRSAVDKIVEKASGVFVNEATVGAVVAATMSVTKWGSSSLVGAATRTVTLGAASGVIAGLRENARYKEERILNSRDLAMGRHVEANARRGDLAETMYQACSARDIKAAIASMIDDETGLVREGFTVDEFSNGIAVLADIKSRISFSDRENIDLIRFTSVEEVETERLDIMIALANSKVRLKEWLESQDDAVQQQLLNGQNSYDDMTNVALTVAETNLTNEVTEKDKLFARMKRRRVAMTAATAAIAGSLVGAASQEIRASFDGGTQGIVERLWQSELEPGQLPAHHQTLIDHAFYHEPLQGAPVYEQVQILGKNIVHGTNAGGGGTFKIDEAFSVSENGSTFEISTPNGHTIEDISFNHDGAIDARSLQILEKNHFRVDHSVSLGEKVVSEEVDVDIKSLIEDHRSEFTTITRDGWFDNDTPKPVFDYNEVQMRWGGEDGTGINPNGDYVYDISHMTSEGSWSRGDSVEWAEAASQGKLKVAISLDAGTQKDVLMVDIDEHGQAVIPKDSLAAKAFSLEDGRAVFTGKYAEVTEIIGKDSEGITHTRPLATDVGDGLSRAKDIIITKQSEVYNNYSFEYIQPPLETVTPDILAIPNIPIVPREALSPWRREHRRAYYGEYRASPEEEQYYRSERSPRLNRDPHTRLNPGEELRWYKSELTKRRGRKYTEEIERIIDSTDELKNVQPDIKTIYTVPVAAAQEHDNIYKVLSLYAQQDRDAVDKSIIILHVNWFKDLMNDSEQAANIAKTKQEIAQARQKFPYLKIAMIETEYDRGEVEKTGGVIGYVAKKMMDLALLSIESAIEKGDIDDDHDVLVVRNDSDMFGMARHHMSQMQKFFDAKRDVDVFKGSTRFGVPMYERYPGFGVVTNFASALSVASTGEGQIHTGGANFGIRASALAAVGGIGFDERNGTGAGSDDVALGHRMMSGRSVNTSVNIRGSSYGSLKKFSYGNRRQNSQQGNETHSYIIHPTGTSIDTNPSRLIPYYLKGKSFQAAWQKGRFDKGGYSEREIGNNIMGDNPREDIKKNFKDIVRFVETNISQELSWASDSVGKKGLSLFFGSVPGAYTIKKTSDGNITFKFTTAGSNYLRNRLERETNGQFGSYGRRKLRQLYRDTSGKRQPVATESPLVAPL